MRKTTLKLPDLFLLLPVTCILARSVPKTEWFTICHPDLMTFLVWQRFFSIRLSGCFLLSGWSFAPSPISGLMVTCMSVLDSSTSIKPLSRPWAVLDVAQGDSGGGIFLQLGLSSLPIISVISYLEIFVLLRRVPFSFLELWLLVLLVSWCSSCWLWPGPHSALSCMGSRCCCCQWWRSCCPPSC